MKQLPILGLDERHNLWMNHDAENGDVVLSSRVRLARNFAGFAFPHQTDDPKRLAIIKQVGRVARSIPPQDSFRVVAMDELSNHERTVLFECRLISQELCAPRAGSGVCFSDAMAVSFMVNEEDHLRIQALAPGLDLVSAWHQADRLDNMIGGQLPYAFDAEYGFLTACPTNLGTGMRASVMLHLPGLVLCKQMAAVVRAVQKLGMTVRGMFGEGTNPTGSMFQFSNQSTLGEAEGDILARLEALVRQLMWAERNSRDQLQRQDTARLDDYVGRAIGVLRYARMLSAEEALCHLGAVRLGVVLGRLGTLSLATVDRLILQIQPGHLQMAAGRTLGGRRRAILRATRIREALRESRQDH